MNIYKKAIFIILFITLPVKAEFPKSESDFVLLPPYCKARFGDKKSENYKAWGKRLGHDFLHLHHYCAGLHTLNLANKETDIKERNYKLTTAIGEMGYVLKNASQEFALLPKIYFDQGNIYELLNQPDKAMQDYQKSLSLNTKNSMPYAAMSDLYLKLNNKKEAIAILEKGLKYKPNSKVLRKHLEKLTKVK